MAAALLVLQAIASLAVLRLLHLLLGSRPVLLVPFALYLFSPLTVSAFDKWTAGVGAVSFQAGLAWVCADALALHRTGRKRYAVSGTLALAVSLLLGEKAVVIPLVAFAVLAVVLRQSGATSPVVAGLRRGMWLWIGLVPVVAVFAWRFWDTIAPRTVAADQSGSLTTAVDAIGTTVRDGILPSLVGGPLFWSDFGVWADPPAALVAAAAIIAVVGVGWSSRLRQGAGAVWALTACYVAVSIGLLVVGRLTTTVTADFALTLRFFPDLVVVVAIAVALVARAPARDPSRKPLLDRTEWRDAGVLLTVFFVGLSLWSTVNYDLTRDYEPTRTYLATAERSLLGAGAPVLDHPVASSLVWGLSAPYNRVSSVFGPVGVETSTSTDEPRVLGSQGALVDAEVVAQYLSAPGPDGACGYRVAPEGSSRITLTRPAAQAAWTVQLDYLANTDGWILVSFESGDAEVAPVRKGVNQVYLSLSGEGGTVTVGSESPDLTLCISRVGVGLLQAVGR
jgi:hypothetical protein